MKLILYYFIYLFFWNFGNLTVSIANLILKVKFFTPIKPPLLRFYKIKTKNE